MEALEEVVMAKREHVPAKAKKSAEVKAKESHDPKTYRRLALALPNVVELSHMGAPDFRIESAGKQRIFATLAYGAKGLGTLMLNAEQQAAFLSDAPEYFSAVPGGWGRMGATLVRVDAPESVLAGALSTAYHQVWEKMSAKKSGATKAKSRA
jgi:hypothetical protein